MENVPPKYSLTLGILRSEPGLTFIFTFVVAKIGFKTKSQTKNGMHQNECLNK